MQREPRVRPLAQAGLGQGTPRRQADPALPHTQMTGGDRLRGGSHPGPGHAGRRSVAWAGSVVQQVVCALLAAITLAGTTFSCLGVPALADPVSGTASSVTASPAVFDQIWMTVDGTSRVAYCAEAANEAPPSGTAYQPHEGPTNIPELDYVCYHGYDGTTIKRLETSGGALLSERRSRAATQAAVWLVISDKRLDLFHYKNAPDIHTNFSAAYHAGRLGNPDYAYAPAYADDTEAYQVALDLVAAAERYAAQDATAIATSPEAGFAELWRTDTMDSDNITYLQWLVVIGEKGGHVELTKTSAELTLTTRNRAYELVGAEYGLYGEEACANLVCTLVTAADGTAASDLVPSGTYWLRETKAPKGYVRDLSVRRVEVSAGEVTTTELEEQPAYATGGVLVRKADAECPDGAQGDASLAGAQFEVRYYDGLYADASLLPGSPVRSWTFQTDADGIARFCAASLVEGDALYVAEGADAPALPLGTYAIRETKAPEGYRMTDTDVHLAQVVQDETAATGAAWQLVGTWPGTFSAWA